MRKKKAYKLLLTGGPCAGKSTIADLVGRSFPEKIIVVPETASLLFRGGFPRWTDSFSHTCLQSAIYHVQIAMEENYENHYPGKILLLDRGTLDGAAYWPKTGKTFFKTLKTTQKVELKRYDQVIYLESASKEDYESNRDSNPSRSENWEIARKLDKKTRALWEKHPAFHIVHNQRSFQDKVLAVLKEVEKAM